MIHSFVESPAFRDHPIASIIVSQRSKQIVGVNKAAQKLFGKSKTSWSGQGVTAFMPEINLRNKKSKLDFTGKGNPQNVLVSSSKLKIANTWYYLIAITPSNQHFDLKGRTKAQTGKTVMEKELSNTIINSLPGVFYLIDETGKFLRWNKNFERVTGYSGFEVSKMLPTDFFEEGPERELIAERVGKVFIDGEADAEASFLTKSKRKVPYYFTGTKITFEGKHCLIGMGIDVTRRRDAERLIKESENDLRAILNSSVDATYFIDLQGRIRLINAAAVVTANVLTKRKISIGDSFLDLLPEQWKESFQSNFQRVLKGEVVEFEREVQVDDEKMMWFYVRYLPVRDEQNKIIGVSNAATDITMRKVAERALIQSEERFKFLYHQTPAMMHSIDTEGKLIRVSDYWLEKIGYSREEVLNKPITDFFTPESRKRAINDGLPRFFATGKTVNESYDLVTKKREILNTLLSSSAERDIKGRIVSSMAVITDITEMKKLEKEVEKLAMIARRTSNAVILTDTKANIIWVNEGFERITEYSREEVIGKKPREILQGSETDSTINAKVRELLNSRKPARYEVLNYAKSGRKYWLDIEIQPIFNEQQQLVNFMAIELDITEQKLAQQKLQQLHDELNAVLNASTDVCIFLDNQYNIRVFNKTAEEFTHRLIRKKLAQGGNMLEYTPPALRDDFKRNFEAAKKGELINIEREIRFSEDFVQWGYIKYIPVRDKSGTVIGVSFNITDITDRKRSEQKLRENEEYLRSIIDTEPSCVKILNSDGELLEMNASGLKMIEADSFSQVVGKNILSLVDEPFRKQFTELTRSVIQGDSGTMQFSITGLKGTKSWLETYAVPLKDEKSNQNYLLGITQDITVRKNSEEALLASNREKDLLIKEIHHRVKNNLQLISSIIYIKMRGINDSEFKDFLEDTRQKIRSIALIHERLLQTGSVNQVNAFDYLGKLILDLQITNQRNDLDVSITHEIDSENLNLDVAIYCGLIINELVTNSIKHAFVGRSQGWIKIRLHKNENGIQLVVSDNGNPISNDIVIDKPESFGMQLLEIFVKQLKGRMEFSRMEGTTFNITFAYP
jgi:PAS domain S-box-containing protein